MQLIKSSFSVLGLRVFFCGGFLFVCFPVKCYF